jgi:hypothetical protein
VSSSGVGGNWSLLREDISGKAGVPVVRKAVVRKAGRRGVLRAGAGAGLGLTYGGLAAPSAGPPNRSGVVSVGVVPADRRGVIGSSSRSSGRGAAAAALLPGGYAAFTQGPARYRLSCNRRHRVFLRGSLGQSFMG